MRQGVAQLIWLPLTYLLVSLSVLAQPRFDSWTIDNGLPQNSIAAILQTRDGYLWLATNGGLVRYDGVRFTVFDVANSPGIKSNRLTALFEDVAGDLWIGTEDSGLIRYHQGTFTSYTTADGLPSNSVAAVEGDRQGRLWVLAGESIAQWADGCFKVFPAQADPPFSRNSVWRSMPREGISFYDRSGLNRFVDGRLVTYTMKDGLSSLRINSIYQDQRGTLWIGTKDRGLNRLKDGAFTTYTVADGLSSDDVPLTAAYEDSQGNLWLAISEKGLSRLKGGKLTTYAAAEGLPSKNIAMIYEDREGSIWIGTLGQGLYRFREEVVTAYSERDGLSANNTYAVFEDRAGSVWIGAWPGLNRYKDGRISRQPSKGGQPFALVSALHQDHEGALWIGTYRGVSLTRWKDGKFTEYKVSDGLASDAVLAIHQDRAGSLWVGTTGGLSRYSNGQFTTYTTADGLASNEVKTIYEDRQGALWIGSFGGLTRFKDGRFVAYTARDGLSGYHVRAIHEDVDGALWVGTYDGGLSRLQDGKFTRYTMRDGLFDNGVFRILEDDRGNFWMSSNRGIYRVSRRELNDFAEGRARTITSVSYGKSDGMLNAECNGGSSPAGTRTKDGRLWFPTQEGVAIIDPAAIRTNELPPPVLIEEFSLNNQRVTFSDRVLIKPGQERFEIRYTGLSFIKPEQIRFKYKLEGLDKDWVEAGTQRTANYSYVPPGNYIFHVMAANSDGVWNTAGAAVRITIQPPFWRTWWFLALASFTVIGSAIIWYERRLWRLKRAQAMQDAFSRRLIDSQENERKRIAAELHDSLGQSLVIIKNRAMLSLNTPANHERALEQLDEIAAAASDAIGEVKDIAYNLRPFQLDRFGLTQAIEAMLKSAAEAHAIQFSASIDEIDGAFSKESEINLYRIVQESVSNIVKHAEATQAWVRIKREGRRVEIIIQDNGKGFVPDANHTGAGATSKFGLIGISERARLLRAKHEIRSLPGEGTTISLKLEIEPEPGSKQDEH